MFLFFVIPWRGAPAKTNVFCGVLVDHGIQVNRCPVRQHRQQRFVSLRDRLINLGPAVKPRGDKRNGPGLRVTKSVPAAQWIPACAGMTTRGGIGATSWFITFLFLE